MHGLSLGLAVGDNQDHAGIHDGLSAHGVGLTGNIVDAVEQAAVGLNGALGEVDAVRALGEVVIGLVEADVAVVADAEQLQIRVTGVGDNLVVLRAGSGGVGVGTVGHMRVVKVDVDVIEEVLTHEVVIALGIVVRKAAILVQVVGADLGKVDVALLVPSSELLVGTDRGGAGGKTQHTVGLEDNLGRDDISGLAAHILVVFSFNDLHYASFLVQERQGSLTSTCPRPASAATNVCGHQGEVA